MRHRGGTFKLLLSGSTALLAVVLLFLFAPTSLGGPFSYAIVRGDSMSPALEGDDVVLLRRSGDYAIGDVIAYRHPQIGNVLHRIVDDDGERFTLRGDNRRGADTYQPARNDVIGRQWAVIPGAGAVIREIQSPRNAALLAFAVIAVLVGGVGVAQARGGRRPRLPLRAGRRLNLGGELSMYAPTGRTVLTASLAVGAGAFFLLALWRMNGTTVPASESLQYEERGSFSYGRVVEGGVYDFDLLAAPEPLFRQLLDDLPLEYRYEISGLTPGTEVRNVLGSYELTAEVSDETGWTRTYTLVPRTPMAGDRLKAAASLSLGEIDRELAAVAERTGIAAVVHSLTITARVQASGTLEGLPFERNSQQSVQFRLTELQLQFDGGNSDLARADTGTVTREVAAPRVLRAPLVPVSVGYSQLPVLGFTTLVFATLAGVAVGLATLVTSGAGEAAQIRARYGRLLVDLDRADEAVGSQPVRLNQIEDLVRIADAEGVAIMLHEDELGAEYFVVTRDTTWRYATWTPGATGPARSSELINVSEG